MDDERTKACKACKAVLRASTPTLCFVAASLYLHCTLAGAAHAHAIEFCAVLLVALALFAVVLVHAVLRPANKDTLLVAALEVAATAVVAYGAARCKLALPFESPLALVEYVACVMFMLVEAKQLHRALTALSDWLDSLVEATFTTEMVENSLRNLTLMGCLVSCVVASLFDLSAYDTAGKLSGAMPSFVVGCVVVLSVLLVCAVLVMPRASVLVSSLTILFISAQLCMLITAEGAAAVPLPKPKPQPTGFFHNLARRIAGQEEEPLLPPSPLKAHVQLLPSTVVAGVFALVACVTSNIALVFGENDDDPFQQVPESFGERLLAGVNKALPVLVPVYPCWVALGCVSCCPPGFVIMQAVVLSVCHCLRAAGIEVHLYPHED